MKRLTVKNLGLGMALFGLGAVLGPLILAAGSAYIYTSEDDFGSDEHGRLIDAYQDSLEPHRLFLSIIPPEDGAECGYNPDDVFPDSINGMASAFNNGSYASYSGYWALDEWRNKQRDEAYIAAIELEMSEEVSQFEAGFLRRCIEGTLFAEPCKRRIESFGKKIDRFGNDLPKIGPASGHEDAVVCGFVDGVAARQGVPLAPAQTTD